MRLLYLYAEEWGDHGAREIQTLSTCAALARIGLDVTLLIAGGTPRAAQLLREVAEGETPGLQLEALGPGLGRFGGRAILSQLFRLWLQRQLRFQAGLCVHLSAAALLARAGIPYLYEAHEILAEAPQRNAVRHQALRELERHTLVHAAWRVATSKALAIALRAHYGLPDDIAVIPNAGLPPLGQSIAASDGPFVYAGPITNGYGIETMLAASRAAGVPLKIAGGSEEEWQRLSRAMPANEAAWQPRVSLARLPAVLTGARAGLIPPRSDSPAGRHRCPLKLFDYARCGLPVLSTALAALDSLDAGSWCARVEAPTVEAWTQAMRNFRAAPVLGETARAWAGGHTWAQRAEKLARLLQRPSR